MVKNGLWGFVTGAVSPKLRSYYAYSKADSGLIRPITLPKATIQGPSLDILRTFCATIRKYRIQKTSLIHLFLASLLHGYFPTNHLNSSYQSAYQSSVSEIFRPISLFTLLHRPVRVLNPPTPQMLCNMLLTLGGLAPSFLKGQEPPPKCDLSPRS